MELIVIGSSSSGNCYILQGNNTSLIIEAGIKFQEVQKALNFDLSKIVGCLISHGHGDHSKYTKNFIKAGINIYSSKECGEQIKIINHPRFNILDKKQEIGEFLVMPFELIHDVKCLGFYIYHAEMGYLCFITDTNYSPFKFTNLNHIMIECNYNQELLNENRRQGKNHYVVYKRTEQSHISQQTCENFLKSNDLTDVNNIILIHLSSSNIDANEVKKDIIKLTGKNCQVAVPNLKINLNLNRF
jgi:phosphoribosyl 1,2-cyclic phosphodiesterase